MSTKLVNLLIVGVTATTYVWLKQGRRPAKKGEDEKKEKCVHDLQLKTLSLELQEEKKNDQLRDLYKPWAMTQSSIAENEKGWVYVRGYSPSKCEGSLLWFRPGLHRLTQNNHEAYFRALIHGFETSVRDAIKRSNGKCQKCNVVLDAENFGIMDIPPMNLIMKLLPIFDILFAGHLGMVVIVNISTGANIFLQMVLPFLPVIVRNKIHILTSNHMKRLDLLKELVEEKFIPSWLGGEDNYSFDVNKYYKSSDLVIISDEEAHAYRKTQ